MKAKARKIKTPRGRENLPRLAARLAILHAANAERLALGHTTPAYTMARLQEAVCVVRRRKAVSAETLVAAGFRAVER